MVITCSQCDSVPSPAFRCRLVESVLKVGIIVVRCELVPLGWGSGLRFVVEQGSKTLISKSVKDIKTPIKLGSTKHKTHGVLKYEYTHTLFNIVTCML
jgi:hypothetical protein